jgi:hypothetical protein
MNGTIDVENWEVALMKERERGRRGTGSDGGVVGVFEWISQWERLQEGSSGMDIAWWRPDRRCYGDVLAITSGMRSASRSRVR